jgi:hypothetical protein
VRIIAFSFIIVSACGFERIPAVQGAGPPADPNQTTVTVDRPIGVVADGSDEATITVTVRDASGAPLVGHDVVVVSSGDNVSNTLDGPDAPTDANGIATATLRSTKAEVKTITATVDPQGTDVVATEQPTVEFVAGPAAQLIFVTPPGNDIAGSAVTPSVEIGFADQYENPVTTATGTITVQLEDNPSDGTLAGTTTVATISGIATFTDLTINRAGVGYTLEAFATGVPSVVSPPFSVDTGLATQLQFLDNPSASIAGSAIAPAVRVAIEDADGNTLNATDAITIAIGSNGTQGELFGTLTVNAVAGVATFADLEVDQSASGYMLTASDGSLSVSSAAFAVLPGPASNIALGSGDWQCGATGEQTAPLVVVVTDAFGNLVPNVTVDFAVSSGDGALSPSGSDTDSSGLAQSVLTLGATGVDVVQATVPGLSGSPVTFRALVADFMSKSDASALSAQGLAVADFNGDGIVDVAVLNGTPYDSVSVLINATAPGAGSATLNAAIPLATGALPDFVAAGDINDDGKADLMVASGSNTFSVFINTTTPGAAHATFATRVDFASGSGAESLPQDIGLADLNGDGKPDVVVANRNITTVSIFMNTTTPGATTPTFAPKVDVAIGSQPVALVLADVNGDGRADLVTGGHVLINTTSPGATTPTFGASTALATTGTFAIAVADLNGDGLPDIAGTNPGSSVVSVLLNVTPPGSSVASFTSHVDFATGLIPISIVAFDVNHDGRPDLVTLNQTGNTVSVLLSETAAGATTPEFGSKIDLPVGTEPYALRFGDFNSDGKLDLVSANNDSNTVSILLDITKAADVATFVPKADFQTAAGPSVAVVDDLNGDGLPDLAVATTTGMLSVMRNTTTPGAATPTFSSAVDFPLGSYATSIAIGDLNGDGEPDLVVSNEMSNTFSVFINTSTIGSTTLDFAAKVDVATESGPFTLALADINGDGKPDVVVGQDTASVSVFLNTTLPGAAVPTFASKVDISAGASATSITIGDVNGDGKPDIAMAITGNAAAVLLNTTATGSSTPTFTSRFAFSIGQNASSVVLSDVNNDGKLDLVVAASAANTVSVLLNTTATGSATATFASHVDFATGAGPQFVYATDLDNDGDSDLIVANFGDGTISVLVNTTVPGATTPSFAGQDVLTVDANPESVTAHDLNGDGIPDLIVPNIGTDHVSVLLGSGAYGP